MFYSIAIDKILTNIIDWGKTQDIIANKGDDTVSKLKIRTEILKRLRIAVLVVIIFIILILLFLQNQMTGTIQFKIGGMLCISIAINLIFYSIELKQRNRIAATINLIISIAFFIISIYLLLKYDEKDNILDKIYFLKYKTIKPVIFSSKVFR